MSNTNSLDSVRNCINAVPIGEMADEIVAVESISQHLMGVQKCFQTDPEINDVLKRDILKGDFQKIDSALDASSIFKSLHSDDSKVLKARIYYAVAEKSAENRYWNVILPVSLLSTTPILATGGVLGAVGGFLLTSGGTRSLFLCGIATFTGAILVPALLVGGIILVTYSLSRSNSDFNANSNNPDVQKQHVIDSWF